MGHVGSLGDGDHLTGKGSGSSGRDHRVLERVWKRTEEDKDRGKG